MIADSAQASLLLQILLLCVLGLGPSLLILKITSDLDGGTCEDKSETLALGFSPILLHGPYPPLWMLPKEISLGLSFSICKMGLYLSAIIKCLVTV